MLWHQREVQLTPLTPVGSGVIQPVQRAGLGLVAFVRRFPVGCISALVLVLVALLAIAAPLVSRYDPTHVQLRERKALPPGAIRSGQITRAATFSPGLFMGGACL